MKLSSLDVRRIFIYDNGTLIRIDSGKLFGKLRPDGYLRGRADGELNLAHRLVWLMFNDTCPEFLDYINGNRADNRIENLRPATKTQNAANRKRKKDNASGHKGVSFRTDRQKWRAQIMVNYRTYSLGAFDKIEDAIAAYREAVVKYNGVYAPQELVG